MQKYDRYWVRKFGNCYLSCVPVDYDHCDLYCSALHHNEDLATYSLYARYRPIGFAGLCSTDCARFGGHLQVSRNIHHDSKRVKLYTYLASIPPKARYVKYEVMDTQRTVSVWRFHLFVEGQKTYALNNIELEGAGREALVAGDSHTAGSPNQIYWFLQKAPGADDRPFNWGLIYDTLTLILDGAEIERQGNSLPLLRLKVFDLLDDNVQILAATGAIGRLEPFGEQPSGHPKCSERPEYCFVN